MPYAREVGDGVLEIRPNEGPQTAFLSTPADIAIYGGTAGGGKSGGLLLAASSYVHVPGYDAIIFRRESTQLRGGGSLWEDSQEIYRLMGGVPVQTPELCWTFKHPKRRAAKIEFRHLQYEKDRFDHQGKQYAFVGFDELTHFTSVQFWYLVSRMRSTCGVRPMLRATCNPDPDSFVRKLIAWWIGDDGFPLLERSGVIRWFVRLSDDELAWADSREELLAEHPGLDPLSLTFILSRLTDNKPLLEADPGYLARLKNLNAVDRARLLGDSIRGGNWNVREAAGELFKRHWFRRIDLPPSPRDVVATVRCWDLAGTKPHAGNPDPDWTRGPKVAKLRDGTYVLMHMESIRDSPGAVEDAIERTAKLDGTGVELVFWRDPGQAGKAQAAALVKKFSGLGYRVRILETSKSKVEWAKGWSPLVEHGHFAVLNGAWNDSFFSEAEAFPNGAHDDQIDAVSGAHQALVSRAGGALSSGPISLGYSL